MNQNPKKEMIYIVSYIVFKCSTFTQPVKCFILFICGSFLCSLPLVNIPQCKKTKQKLQVKHLFWLFITFVWTVVMIWVISFSFKQIHNNFTLVSHKTAFLCFIQEPQTHYCFQSEVYLSKQLPVRVCIVLAS